MIKYEWMQHKIRKIPDCLFFVIVIVILAFLGKYTLETAVPVFSVEEGFFDEGFYLELSAPDDCEIYYTLDGSIPDEDSYRYEEPIWIGNRLEEPNKYSNIKNVSGLQLLGQDIWIPYDDIRKANIISARVLGSTGRWSDTEIKTYFVGFDAKDYNNVPILSLVIDPDDLFGDNGIYINGNDFDEITEEYVPDTELSAEELLIQASSIWQKANWAQKGTGWKREGFIEYFGHGEIQKSKIKINIAGGMSRIYPQKSLSVSFSNKFAYPIIAENYSQRREELIRSYEEVKLRQGGSQNLADFLNDYFVQKLSTGLEFDTQAQELAILFLNGEYWGIYTICEKYASGYFTAHYGIDSRYIALIKGGSVLDMGKLKDLSDYNDLIEYIHEADFSIQENYQQLCDQIDIDSFIELYCTNLYFANTDFFGHNIACWRYYDEKKQEYSKWKFMMYDCDLTFNDNYDLISAIELYREYDDIFPKLLENKEFEDAVILCFERLRNEQFSMDRIEGLLSQTEEIILPLIGEYYDRFGPAELAMISLEQQNKNLSQYIDRVYSFMEKRYAAAIDEVYFYFGRDVYDISSEDLLIDFSENGNSQYFIKEGFYSADSEGSYAQNNAEIIVKLASDVSCLLDMSANTFADNTEIKFNGVTIWKTSDGIDKLSSLVIDKNLLNINDKNIISITTDEVILSPKELGISEDPRILAHRISKIIISRISD